jgi:hypothetical protein
MEVAARALQCTAVRAAARVCGVRRTSVRALSTAPRAAAAAPVQCSLQQRMPSARRLGPDRACKTTCNKNTN